MTQFDIKRWDIVLFDNSNTQIPIIYIKPDIEFIKYVEKNNFVVMAKITESNTIYDGKSIPGIVSKSSHIPNFRPNYFEKNKYYVITLHANWYGYPNPKTLGKVSFEGIIKPIIEGEKIKLTPYISDSDKSNQNIKNEIINSKSFSIFKIFIIAIIVICVTLFIFSIHKK